MHNTLYSNANVELNRISDNYSKTSGSLWQYCKEIPAINDDGDIIDFNGANTAD